MRTESGQSQMFLMTDALILGAQMEKPSITPEVILAAAGNQNLV